MKLPEDKKKFIEYIEKGVSITKSCKLINIHRSTFYEWKAKDPEFLSAYLEAEVICRDETNDAAAYHYKKWVLEGDKKFVAKWLDQQHPDYMRKTLNVVIRREDDTDAVSTSLNHDELFMFIRAFEHSGFKVADSLDEKTKEKYMDWYVKNTHRHQPPLKQSPEIDTVFDIISKKTRPSSLPDTEVTDDCKGNFSVTEYKKRKGDNQGEANPE